MAKLIPTCLDTEGACFARSKDGSNKCQILTDCPERCSFKKPERFVTKGKRYEYNSAAAAEKEIKIRR